MLTPPTFAVPRDGLVTTLASAHAIGSGVLTLTDATRLGSPTPSAPLRLTVLAVDGAAILGQFLARGVSGNSVNVIVDAGWTDATIPAGAIVGSLLTAAGLLELQAAILATVDAVNSVQLTPGPKGDTGATGPAGPPGSGGSATPAGAAGHIQFSNGTTFAADAALNWDATGKRLGLGTASPSTTSMVHVDRAINAPVQMLISNASTGDHAQSCIRLGLDPSGTDFGNESIAMGAYGPGFGDYGDATKPNYGFIETGLAALVFVCNGGPIIFCAAGVGEAMRIDSGGQIALNKLGRLAPNTTPLTVAATAVQTANLTTWQDSAGNQLAAVGARGEYRVASLTDSAAASGSLFYSTTAGKLAFKDPSGGVHTLY